MRARWRQGAIVVVAVLVVVAGANWWGMDPQPLLLGALVIAVVCGAWAVWGMSRWTAPEAVWPPAHPADQDHHIDWQVAALRIRVEFVTSDPATGDRLRESLVSLVDDRLSAEHGIDRRTDPRAAGDVLGHELSRFVADPGGLRWRRRDLERIVARIEAL
jgi:hypothetical protein